MESKECLFLLSTNLNLDYRVNWCCYEGQMSLKSHVLVISNIKTTSREIPLKVLRGSVAASSSLASKFRIQGMN